MATRRFRIKAVANVSVSRGRCGEKPRESEKFDEKTSSNSSGISDSQEASPKETILAESKSDVTFTGKVSNDSSLNETLENSPGLPFVQNTANVSESACGEANDSDRPAPVDTPVAVNCQLEQHPADADVLQSDCCNSKDVSLCNRTDENIIASNGEHILKAEETMLGDFCATSAQNVDTAGTKRSSAPLRLPRKRMKPPVSLSLVNRKPKESPTVEISQQCSANKVDESSTVPVSKKLQTSETSSDLDKDVETVGTGTIPAASNGTKSSDVLSEVQEKDNTEIVPQTCVEAHISQTNECKRKNETALDVMSVDTPTEEPCTSAVSVSTPTRQNPVVSDSPAGGNEKGSSPSVKCSANQSVKDCIQLNSFRSRFIRPKPLLESAARRNRTASIGSASESDSEKKSLSSATTVSPPWQPKLKTSRTRLTHIRKMETDKLANASGASADESEEEHGSVSGAETISPPKKITKLDSDGGSDTSHSEFSQEVSEESSSPVKKSHTKPERVTKRKEYLRRIIEIKKEISHKVGDGKVNKSRLTMFDLIYYNPVTNPMKSVQGDDVKKSGPAPVNATESEKRLAEESVDEPEALEDEEPSSTVPVPQVKVGPNGEIILDEQSLVIETTDAKKNWNDLQNSEVIMDYGTGTTTFNAYSKKRKIRTKDWNREETLRFYRALHTVGTDFLVMQSLFPKFTRKELKDRYKKEERINRALVEKALRNPLTFDLTQLQKEFEVERLEEEKMLSQPKKAEKPKQKRVRRSCSLFAALDSTDKGKLRNLGNTLGKRKIKEKPVKRKYDELNVSQETHSEKRKKAESTRTSSECTPDRGASNLLNGHVDRESSVPEANCLTKIKPTRSGRIPRPRIFEDFMTDNVEEICEETEITEICDRVTVEDVCESEPVIDANPSEHEELVVSEQAVADDNTMAAYESENDDQNFVIAEDALTVQQSQVNLGSCYSNIKPGTLIVLATESPDNPGHQIFRVFMVSNNSQTLPVSVTNNQASSTNTTNSVEMGTSTDPVASESSTNDCKSLEMNAENSS